MSVVAQVEIDFELLECGECGIAFQFTKVFKDARKEDCATFYCPNGHGRAYHKGQSKADKLQKRLEMERGWRADEASNHRDTALCLSSVMRSNSALRGALTRKKNQEMS